MRKLKRSKNLFVIDFDLCYNYDLSYILYNYNLSWLNTYEFKMRFYEVKIMQKKIVTCKIEK